jgi:RND family efflux transporter MFP subunit
MKLSVSILAVILILAGAVALLLHNKSVLDARAQAKEHPTPAVRIQTMESRTSEQDVTLIGTLDSWRAVDVCSETQGRTIALYADRGSIVGSGAALAAVDSSVAHERAAAAEAALRKARADLRRNEALHRAGNTSESDLERARLAVSEAEAQFAAARKALRDAVIRSPFRGIVAERHVETGSMLAPGAPVMRIVDISRFRLNIKAAAHTLEALRVGMRVTVLPDRSSDQRLAGVVRYVAPEADAGHLFDVEIAVENPGDERLRAGMLAEVRLQRTVEPALLAPRTAVSRQGEQAWVFVLEMGRAKKRPVTLGAENGTHVEVLSGLEPGEQLIVSSHQTLRDGIAVDVRGTETGRES